MNEETCLSLMKGPGQPRPGKWRHGVIQILITNACDRSCYSCTQGSNLAGKPTIMTLENFEIACSSLVGYFGVVGIFGGNPALHPQFPEICKILSRYIPYEQRGIWCNNPLGHASLMSHVFNPAYSNLNVHQDPVAYEEFKKHWPHSRPFGLDQDSRHSPVFGSMIDLGLSEEERWERISTCDINQHWSALIGQFRGEPRAWFCEIAGAQSMKQQDSPCPLCSGEKRFPVVPKIPSDTPQTLACELCGGTGKYPDTGIYPFSGWWKKPIEDFRSQIRHHCHNCLVPMRGHGQLANSTTDSEQTTQVYQLMFRPKRPRPVQVVTSPSELGDPLKLTTDYVGNAK